MKTSNWTYSFAAGLLAAGLFAGCAGDDGLAGADGDDGAAGTAGENGTAGTDGTDGTDGTNGTNGADGTNGTNGADGIAGTDGIDGLAGTDGLVGVDGLNGTDGVDGLAGTDGVDGFDGCDDPAAMPREIWLDGPAFYPEGIATAADGTSYVGSLGQGEIVMIPFGSSSAAPFATGLRSVTGMIATDTQLWACDLDATGASPGTLTGFDRATGAVVATHDLPAGNGSFCNDLTMDDAGNIYITDTAFHQIVRIPAANLLTNNSAAMWSSDAAFTANINTGAGDFSLNGIAFDGVDSIYSVNFTSGELYKIAINGDGTAAAASVITIPARWDVDGNGSLDVGLNTPDGLKFLDADTLIVAENFAGSLSAIDLDGAGGAVAWPINSRLDTPATFAIFNGMAWVTESQADHFFGIDPNPPLVSFRIVGVPLGDLYTDEVTQVIQTADDSAISLCPVPGAWARMTRTDTNVSLTVNTNGLEPGAYTNWWVAINNPECLDPAAACDPDVAAFWANGFVVDGSGSIMFTSTLDEGVNGPQGQVLNIPALGITGTHLVDTRKAMIQYVIKWHGAASTDATELDLQINDVFGLCAANFPALTAAAGFPFCPDLQRIDSMP